MNLFVDYETWSGVNIRRGTDVYMAHAKPLILTAAIDDNDVKAHDFTVDHAVPNDFRYACKHADRVIAHSAFFEQMVHNKLLDIPIPIHKWHCTQAHALAHSLPGGLEPLGRVLGIPLEDAKISDGKRLIRKFCCGPNPPTGKDEEWARFIEYAINDIKAMRQCYKLMPNWNYKGEEHRIWQVDQLINHRGFAIDLQFAREAVKALEADKARLNAETSEATGGEVTAATQRDKLLLFLCEKQGCVLRDLKAATITEALADESLDISTRTLLELRRDSTKTSTSKFKRLEDSVGADGRLRGTLQYAGASRTSRWAGRIFQPQNLPRPDLPIEFIRLIIAAIREGRPDIAELFAPLTRGASNGLRGLIIASPGQRLVVGDWSSFEGRINAWIAGEDWKVKAFRDGIDLYIANYERAFNLPPGTVTKKDPRRQIGKVMELALGFQGGVGAFLNMAGAYNLDLVELGRLVQPDEKSHANWERALKTGEHYMLPPEIYKACDTLKNGYRKANPEIEKSWFMYESAMRRVIEKRDPTYKAQVGMLMFDADASGRWARIQLPSGRFLCYALPRIMPDGTITYMAWRNRKWSRTGTYGGKICENVVQAIQRDFLAQCLVKLEDRGFNPVLHVHDEPVCDSATKTAEELLAVMLEKPRWAAGLPVGAECFVTDRYEKH